MAIYAQMILSKHDSDKLTVMFEAHKEWVHGLGMRILQNYHDAEDLTQKVFLYAAKNMDKISAPVCPKTRGYLAIITKHIAIDIIRERRTVELDEELVWFEEPFYDGELLMAAIAKLPKQHQAPFLLRFQHGYTVHELAKFYGVKYDTMQKQLRRTKEKLKEILQEEGMLV